MKELIAFVIVALAIVLLYALLWIVEHASTGQHIAFIAIIAVRYGYKVIKSALNRYAITATRVDNVQ